VISRVLKRWGFNGLVCFSSFVKADEVADENNNNICVIHETGENPQQRKGLHLDLIYGGSPYAYSVSGCLWHV
jgi:hypothetical protein